MKIACASLLLVASLQEALAGSWITRAGKFQGDIALTVEQERQLNASFNGGNERQAIIIETNLWPDDKIPYVIDNAFTSDEIDTINEAIADYTANTCIQWVERTDEDDYVEIIKDDGCWSYVGRWSSRGRQELSLGNGCVWKYIIVHEMMHAAGFYHEQSRYDRDDYVTINWDNICCGASSNFNKLTTSNSQNLDEPYDIQSIMHYDEYDFSTSWGVLKTIEAIDGTSPLGNNVGFTQTDINKLNKLYECSASTASTSATTASTSQATTTTEQACEDIWTTRKCEKKLRKNKCGKSKVALNCPLTCGAC